MTHIRFTPKSLAVALLAGVAALGAGVSPVLADPLDWAPAHGWRAKQERHHERERHDRERHERGRYYEHGYIDGGYGDGRVVIVRRPRRWWSMRSRRSCIMLRPPSTSRSRRQ
ncbi:hypothetical protein [Azospirillum sp. Marseille-Q6669]